MRNTSGLNLTNSVCHECGLVHPPVEGGCPMASNDTKQTQQSGTHSREDKKILNMTIELTTMVKKRFFELKFENEYSEDKFYKSLNKTVMDNLKEFLDGYKL